MLHRPLSGFLIAALIVGFTGPAAAQPAPTYNEVVYGIGTLDAGGTMPLHFDLYKPPGIAAPTPVVLWIHGGGWQGGSHNTVPTFAADLLSRGVSVASVEYRLSGQAIFPAQIHDLKGAVRFLRANAPVYGINPLRIGAWGSSAGGHLAALLATSGGVADADGNIGVHLARSSRILAAADYFGPSDLLSMQLDITNPPGSGIDHDAYTSPESRLIGFDQPGEGIGVLRANQNNPAAPYPQLMSLVNLVSPITHVSFDDPILFISHGTADTSVPIKQSQRLYDALNAAGVSATYLPVTGAGHGNLGTATNDAAVQFLVRELTRPLGDANRDAVVDITDLGILATHWQSVGGWAQGDFNSDGLVNIADLGLLASNWQSGDLAAALAQPSLVPEPTCAAVACAAVAMLLRHRPGRTAAGR